jgi:hypothetical protein
VTGARRYVTKLVAVAAVAFTPACGEKDIRVAVIVDSGIDAMPIRCGALDGGSVRCEAGSFCSACDDSIGTCDTPPPQGSCAQQGYEPECDCNGVTYFNGCLRRAAGAGRFGSAGTCLEKAPVRPLRICNLTDNPCGPNETCVKVFPSFVPPPYPDAGLTSVSPACQFVDQFSFGQLVPDTCWVLPDTCPSSGGHGSLACGSECINTCQAPKAGGNYFYCPP